MNLSYYHARDRRVYNGALCSDMQREADSIKSLEEKLVALDSTASCTYFPVEGKYLCFSNTSKDLEIYMKLEGPPKILTGNFHESLGDALIEAIKVLTDKKK